MAKFDGNIMSKVLEMETSVSVYLPHDDEKYHKNQKPLRTMILLHGFTGNHSNWHRYTALERYAAENNIAVITPDGGFSMYANMSYGQNYFDYVSTELIEIIHKMFMLPVNRENLFIGGLSMGGYGALKAALTYPDRFAKCIAFSSATMLGTPEFVQQVKDNHVNYMIGAFGNEVIKDTPNNVYHLIEQFSSECMPEILMTCGRQDTLLAGNKRCCAALRRKGFSVTWKEWDGAHDWKFWDESIQYAMNEFL